MSETTSLSAGELAALRERATYDATHWQNAILKHEEFAALLAAAAREAALAARVAELTGLVEQAYKEGFMDAQYESARKEGPDLGWRDSSSRAALAPKEAGHG